MEDKGPTQAIGKTNLQHYKMLTESGVPHEKAMEIVYGKDEPEMTTDRAILGGDGA